MFVLGLHEDVNRVEHRPTNTVLPDIDDSLSDNQKADESWRRYLRIDNSFVVDVFVGQLKSTLQCTTCGHCSVTFDPFWDLSLPIPSRTGQVRLQQCLEHFTREEVLDGDEKPVSLFITFCAKRSLWSTSLLLNDEWELGTINCARGAPAVVRIGHVQRTAALNSRDCLPTRSSLQGQSQKSILDLPALTCLVFKAQTKFFLSGVIFMHLMLVDFSHRHVPSAKPGGSAQKAFPFRSSRRSSSFVSFQLHS